MDLQLPIQSVPITKKVVSSKPVQGKVYLIPHYMIKFVSDLWQVGGFSPGTEVASTNKTDHHNKTEILVKVALNTIKLTSYEVSSVWPFSVSKKGHYYFLGTPVFSSNVLKLLLNAICDFPKSRKYLF